MAVVFGQWGQDGAVVDVLIGVHDQRRLRLLENELPVPPPVPVRLQVDTGAELTLIDGRVFTRLGIPIFDTRPMRPISLTGATFIAPPYVVRLGLPGRGGDLQFHAIYVVGCHMTADEGIVGVLGRDVLEHCLFVQDGIRKTFTLAW